jgi:subtilisin family serine protease
MTVHIAMIDDGVNEKTYGMSALRHNIEITPEFQAVERMNYDPYDESHGTICGAIIKKYAGNFFLSSVKVNDKNKRNYKNQLLQALDWCAANGIDLINLSLGTVEYKDFQKFQDTVNHAASIGIIIIAACNNKDIYTLPASLSNVIGVKCDKAAALTEGQYQYNINPFDEVDITACGYHTILDCWGEEIIVGACNSYAASLITAKVCNIMNDTPGIALEGIKNTLKKGAENSPGIKSFINMYKTTTE